MRHNLTCASVLAETTVRFLHEQREKQRRANRDQPKGYVPGQLSLLKMYQAPNVLIFGRGENAPVPGQKGVSEENPTPSSGLDTKEPPAGSKQEVQGRKQVLRGFSSKSSLSISKLLSSIDWKKNGQCIHVTLTYHKVWPDSKSAIQREKISLVNGLSRLGVECGIWKLEYQNRKTGLVPHWHILIWIGGRDYEQFTEVLVSWWQKRTHNHSPYSVAVRPGDTGRASFYLCLHSAKSNQTPNIEVGRWWGYINRKKLQASVDINLVGYISERERVWYYRMYRRFRRIRSTRFGTKGFGFTWFLPRASQQQLSCWVRDTVEHELWLKQHKDPF